MNITRLCLLAALPALAGCVVESTALEPIASPTDGVATQAMDRESGDWAAPEAFLTDPAAELVAEFPLMPRIELFDVEPAALPLGGGPVLVSWDADDVANCSLVVDNVPALSAIEGELMIDVAEDADVHLVCLDEDQALVAEARHEVTVVQPPVDAFEADESIEVEIWESTSLVGRTDAVGEVHEVSVVLPEDGRLVVDIAAVPARAQFELWLAADVNGDGVLAPEEVLEVTRSSDVSRLDEVLPAGEYSLFVVTVTGASTWELVVSVVEPDSDGNNF